MQPPNSNEIYKQIQLPASQDEAEDPVEAPTKQLAIPGDDYEPQKTLSSRDGDEE
jgi:hypothetical protein